ncbi:WD40 repeat-like protein [Ramaria rubella]|nr:WD40 repeat-like protein [Ramaria rubella]
MNTPATVQFTVVKASGLSKCPIRIRKYYALVYIDSGETYRTKTVKSRNPKWKEPFDLVARDPSMIVVVDIFQVINEAEKMIGRASVSMSECFQPGFQNIERSYDLSDASNQKAGKLKVSLSPHIHGSTEAVALDAHLPITALQAIVLPVVTIASLGLNIPVLESLMQSMAASSHLSTPFGVGIAGTVIDVGSNVIASDSFSTVMGFMTRFVEIGDMVAEVHPYAKFVWNVLTSMRKVLKAQQDQDDKVKQLWATILETLDFMKQVEDAEIPERIQGVEKTVQAIMKQIYDCALFLRRYGEEGFKGRTLNNALTTKTDDSIQQFMDAFTDLRTRFRERIDLDKWKVARTMKDGVLRLVTKTDQLIDIAERNDLKDLPGAKLPDVQWDPSRACMPGTRTQIIRDIISWVHNPESKRILWLSGAAGTGKSSIANSIAEQLDSVGRLGASFRFDRQTATIETRGQLFGNLCHQLALYDGQLRNAILTVINKTNIYGMSLRNQARKLLVETTRSSEIIGPVVIIIDALDECGDDHSKIEPTRGTLVQAIVEELPMLSSSIKVLITSRDEGIISNLFTQCKQCLSWTMNDVQSTEEDILKYVQHQMSLICQSHGSRLDNWPGAAKETEIAHYADGLFIWADIACTYIGQGDPAIQLSRLLKSAGKINTVGSRLEELINHVFHRSLQETIGANEWHYVVDSIVTLKTPLTLEGMDSLLGLSEELSNQPLILVDGHQIELTTSDYIITSLRPILRNNHDMMDNVQLLHKSVYDFLINQAPESIQVHLPASNGILAAQCLDYMTLHLHYDVCGIGSTSLLNSDIPDLSDRIKCIPEALQYTCQYFAYHINDMSYPLAGLTDKLHHFITEHLLHWIEVMSFLGNLYKAEICLELLARYLKKDLSFPLHIAEVINEAIMLLRNHGNVITLAALHIYASVISLTPKTTELYKIYDSKLPTKFTIMSSHPFWANSLCTLEAHTGTVTFVTFSPDGRKLASASNDHTAQLWDVETGTPIGTALEGHSNKLTSITFSPDGRKLASASYDNTVQLWDVETGTPIGTALEGHSVEITSVTFLPDGRKLASASDDNTVQLWDVETGTAIGTALEGHSDWTSVTFSHDGGKLASVSRGNTVQLWDVETGTAIGTALEGHSVWITSITFSSDGRKLATVSFDNTVQLWDVETGTPIGTALEGHINKFIPITFSPDGRKLASASYDNTVQLWDVETATAIGTALEGHSDQINSVTFSPDGRKLASASDDKTVQLWDVETGTAIGTALEGHSDSIKYVTFSPNGKKLASASRDNTVRLWDVETGPVIRSALKGHSHFVTSVTFSHDGSKLASASDDKTVQLWDVEKGTTIGSALEGHSSSVSSVTFSPDGRMLASASHDKTVKLWDVETGTAIGTALEGHSDWINAVTFSHDGSKLASASDDKTVQLWDVEKGTAIGSALEGHRGSVTSVTFSPDGRKLASASTDKTVQLWDVETGTAIGSALEGHSNWITYVTFSLDGRKLVSASESTVLLWDVETQTLLDSCGSLAFQSIQIPPFTPIIDQSGFLCYSNHILTLNAQTTPLRLLWLPPQFRGGSIVIHDRTIVIGGEGGAVTFVKMPPEDQQKGFQF